MKNCQVCQQNKPEHVASLGLLQPLPIPRCIFSDISMDFVERLPRSRGKDVIMVIVDRLIKYSHFIALVHLFIVSTVTNTFMENVYKLHGNPSSIVSDRRPTFISKFWQNLFKLYGVSIHLSSSYHPQTDGQTEVVN